MILYDDYPAETVSQRVIAMQGCVKASSASLIRSSELLSLVLQGSEMETAAAYAV
jgi:hypothetical protein